MWWSGQEIRKNSCIYRFWKQTYVESCKSILYLLLQMICVCGHCIVSLHFHSALSNNSAFILEVNHFQTMCSYFKIELGSHTCLLQGYVSVYLCVSRPQVSCWCQAVRNTSSWGQRSKDVYHCHFPAITNTHRVCAVFTVTDINVHVQGIHLHSFTSQILLLISYLFKQDKLHVTTYPIKL